MHKNVEKKRIKLELSIYNFVQHKTQKKPLGGNTYAYIGYDSWGAILHKTVCSNLQCIPSGTHVRRFINIKLSSCVTLYQYKTILGPKTGVYIYDMDSWSAILHKTYNI